VRDTHKKLPVALKKIERWVVTSLGEKIFYRLLAWVPTFRITAHPIMMMPTNPISSVSMKNAGVW